MVPQIAWEQATSETAYNSVVLIWDACAIPRTELLSEGYRIFLMLGPFALELMAP